MRVFGIDPGSARTGYGCVQGDGTRVGFSGQPFDVPPGATIDVTGSSAAVTSDPAKRGVIEWGSPERSQPVVRLDGRPVGDGRPGAVTRALQARFAEAVARAQNASRRRIA